MTYRKLTREDYEEAAAEFERDFEPDPVHRFFAPMVGDPLRNALAHEFSFEPPDGPSISLPADMQPRNPNVDPALGPVRQMTGDGCVRPR